jgi:hypothetical protein
MRNVLRQHLLPLNNQSVQILECHPQPVNSWEGFRYAVQYNLKLLETATGSTTMRLITGVSYPAKRTRAVWETLREAETQPYDTVFPPYTYVPGLDLLVQVFPFDHQLPALATLLSGAPCEPLSRIVHDLRHEGWRVESWSNESIRYRVGVRATVRLTARVRHDDTNRTLDRAFYAKVYRKPDTARYAYEILSHLNERARARSARFSVPEPMAMGSESRTLIQSHAPGIPLLQLLRRGRDVVPAIESAARAVADLHSLDLSLPHLDGLGPPRSLQNRLARLRRAGELVGAERPDLAPELANIVDTIIAGLADDVPLAPTHGDLKPDHILVAGDAVSIIDFDDLRISDPVLDVANLHTHLARLQSDGAVNVADESTAELTIAQKFVAEYFAHAPQSLRSRLVFYQAMTGMMDAARSLRRGNQRRRNRIDEFVREAHATLNHEGR